MPRSGTGRRELSKAVSHALRHEPWLYELELDADGWTPVDDLVAALRREERFAAVTRADVDDMVQRSEKHRHEVDRDRIRARYGHSLPGRIDARRGCPPDLLLHGTSPENAELILGSRLMPMGRQYVHLSVDVETARSVGARKHRRPVVLEVESARAAQAGVVFLVGNAHVWLADEVPGEFIRLRPGAGPGGAG